MGSPDAYAYEAPEIGHYKTESVVTDRPEQAVTMGRNMQLDLKLVEARQAGYAPNPVVTHPGRET